MSVTELLVSRGQQAAAQEANIFSQDLIQDNPQIYMVSTQMCLPDYNTECVDVTDSSVIYVNQGVNSSYKMTHTICFTFTFQTPKLV